MGFLVPLTLYGLIPAVVILFLVMPPKRAVLFSFLGAWMFLPMAAYQFKGFPDYTKVTATFLGVFLATTIFDFSRFLKLRPNLCDLPMLAWCLIPFVSSIKGGFGAYEGLTSTVNQLVTWGCPYLIGRLYLGDLASLRDLAVASFVGGLVYMPLCWIELRLSPQLHIWVYGYFPHDFAMTRRGDGFRPQVFMQHGLALAVFMSTASLMGFWLAFTGSLKRLFGLSTWMLVLPLVATTVLCKSTGATVLMFAGLGVLLASHATRLSLPVWVLVAIPILYPLLRTVGDWDAQQLVDLARHVSQRASDSLRARIVSEDGVWYFGQPSKWFGLGRFMFTGQSVDPGGFGIIPDGLWMITLAKNGLVGLALYTLAGLAPVAAFLLRFRAATWRHPLVAASSAWGVALSIYMIDCLANGMINPIFLLALGGLAGARPVRLTAPRPAPVRAVYIPGVTDAAPQTIAERERRARLPSPPPRPRPTTE